METVYSITIFGINLKINPIAFTIGSWSIYWYGILIATGFLLAVIYAMTTAKRYELNTDRMLDVILFTTPFAILCARAYYCIFYGNISSVKEFFGLGNGNGFQGLAIYGGVIGAVIGAVVMCKIRKVNLFDMLDVAAPAFLLAQAIGRWGNFTNQEAFGTPTNSSWFGMMSENTGMVNVHPCFLYESIWCIIGFILLNHFSKSRKFKGEIALMYGVWYCFGRAFIEVIRTDSLYIGKVKVSLLLSIIVFAVSLILLIVNLKKSSVSGNEENYVALFETENEEITVNIDESNSEENNE